MHLHTHKFVTLRLDALDELIFRKGTAELVPRRLTLRQASDQTIIDNLTIVLIDLLRQFGRLVLNFS